MADFNMRTPCRHCPFRSDIRPFLTGERAEEIAEAIERGLTFTCHKTVDYSDEQPHETDASMHCAGALIIAEKEGCPPQMARIAERLGMYDRTKLDMSAPVYESFSEWVDAAYEAAS